jgi:hypothetical protein
MDHANGEVILKWECHVGVDVLPGSAQGDAVLRQLLNLILFFELSYCSHFSLGTWGSHCLKLGIPRASTNLVEEHLIECSVGYFTIESFGTRIGFLPVVVTPCSNLHVHSFGHRFCLESVGDDGINLSCGTLAELEEEQCFLYELDTVQKIAECELRNCLLVRGVP